LDPRYIESSRNIAAMDAVLNAAVKCGFSIDSKINHNPNLVKLMALLQTVLRYLLRCQDQLKGNARILEAQNRDLEAALEKSHATQNRLWSTVQLRQRREKCVACGREFVSISALDSHVDPRHCNLYTVWMAIRRNEPCEIQHSSKVEMELRRTVQQLQREKPTGFFFSSPTAIGIPSPAAVQLDEMAHSLRLLGRLIPGEAIWVDRLRDEVQQLNGRSSKVETELGELRRTVQQHQRATNWTFSQVFPSLSV
jgi:hypothetical protein